MLVMECTGYSLLLFTNYSLILTQEHFHILRYCIPQLCTLIRAVLRGVLVPVRFDFSWGICVFGKMAQLWNNIYEHI